MGVPLSVRDFIPFWFALMNLRGGVCDKFVGWSVSSHLRMLLCSALWCRVQAVRKEVMTRRRLSFLFFPLCSLDHC